MVIALHLRQPNDVCVGVVGLLRSLEVAFLISFGVSVVAEVGVGVRVVVAILSGRLFTQWLFETLSLSPTSSLGGREQA